MQNLQNRGLSLPDSLSTICVYIVFKISRRVNLQINKLVISEMFRCLSLSCIVCRMWWCLWATLWIGWSQTSPRTSVSRYTRRRSSWLSSLWRKSMAKGLQHGTTTARTTAIPLHQPIRAHHSHGHGLCPMQTAVKLPRSNKTAQIATHKYNTYTNCTEIN